jgi:tetratricopeptide (TPR) repeat protein
MPRPAFVCILAVVTFTVLAASLPTFGSSRLPQADSSAKPEAVPADFSAEQLIERGDELRAEKLLTSALENYHAALVKAPASPAIDNRIGIVEMELSDWKHSMYYYQLAVKTDPTFADAYNNLAVDYYELKKYKKAIALYDKAIKLRGDEASYYSNLGAAYFSRKDFAQAAQAYTRALQLDPDVLEHTSRTGVSARLPSPEDRAHFDYSMAKLYAGMGAADHSLEHLRRALEEGYKHINDVYRDEEFANLRKDPRFAQLMAKRPAALPE